MGDRFIEGAEDLSVSTIDSTDNTTINDVIGNKEDTAQVPSSTTSIISILKKIYSVVISISGSSDPIQVKYIKVTSPANSPTDTTLITADGNVMIESVIVQADSAQTIDMTSCGIYGGTNNVLEIINHKDGKYSNLDAVNKQIGWSGYVHLSDGVSLVMEHVGNDTGVLDLTVSIMYRGDII